MEYLKYFITEEIYILPPKADVTAEETFSSETNKDPAPQPPDKKSDYRKYSITIISHKLNDDDKNLLNSIISAIKLDPKEVQHINTYKDISAGKVIIFGDFPEIQGLARYQIVTEDGKETLVADELRVIAHEISKKQLLWSALKKMFSV